MIATVLGVILGIDRDIHRKPAGIRVMSMVSLGSCAIVMASISALVGPDAGRADGLLRTVQGVLAGIGFLGAGVIMRAKGSAEVHGMNTAALIYISAILGMICGVGQWILAISVFAVAWLILVGGRWIEDHIQVLAKKGKKQADSD